MRGSRRSFHVFPVFLLIARSVMLWWAMKMFWHRLNDNVEGILSCSLAFQWNRSSAGGIRMKWGPICAIRKDDGFCRTGTAKECAFTEFIQGSCHFSTVRFEQTHFETLVEIHATLTDCVLCARFTACALCVQWQNAQMAEVTTCRAFEGAGILSSSHSETWTHLQA